MTFYQSKLKELRNTIYSNDHQIRTVIGIKNYIANNYEAELNLDFLSHTSFISKYHLLRLFKKYYGQTPRQYLIDRRIEKSKEYLKDNLSVSETCFTVGFESVGSFSTLFKSKTGKSPREYQKEQLSRNDSASDFSTL